MTNPKDEALPKCILCETPLTQLGLYGLRSVVWYFRCEKEDCEMFMADLSDKMAQALSGKVDLIELGRIAPTSENE